MKDIEAIVAELRKKYDSHRSALGDGSYRTRPDLTVSDEIEIWSERLQLSRSELFDRITLALARGFQNSELPFEFCNAVINDLFGAMTLTKEAIPSTFWKVYLAFDEGEYRHQTDDAQVDPAEKYTRPMVSEILSQYADLQTD